MIPTRLLAAALVAATAFAAGPADATKPKPTKGSYDVTLLVPYAGPGHCADAPDGTSKHERSFTLAGRGTFRVSLGGRVGEWAVEIYDARRRLVGSAADALVLRRKRAARERYVVMVCNRGGTPNATVSWTYTPA